MAEAHEPIDVFHNPCGGTRWRQLPDGTIEVEGHGVPTFAPGSSDYNELVGSFENFEPEIRAAAARNGVPLPWMLAILHNETGGAWKHPARQACPPVGGAGEIGPFQIIPVAAREVGIEPQSMCDPEQGAEAAARILRRSGDKRDDDFVRVAAAYNAGSVRCSAGQGTFGMVSTHDYPMRAAAGNNTAILELGLGSSRAGLKPVLWVVALGSFAFAGWALWKTRRR